MGHRGSLMDRTTRILLVTVGFVTALEFRAPAAHATRGEQAGEGRIGLDRGSEARVSGRRFTYPQRTVWPVERLLRVRIPSPRMDFVQFWRGLRDRTSHVPVQADMHELASPDPRVRLHEISYQSVDGVTIRGWLTTPAEGPITRGIVLGHGYGGWAFPDDVARVPLRGAAAIFPCARGIGLSERQAGVPSDPGKHVLHGIESRDSYVLGKCAADMVWGAASALLELVPELARQRNGPRLDYFGISFGGGVGALALPWDDRFTRAHLILPSFGNQRLRVRLPSEGSAKALAAYFEDHPQALGVLEYFDAANAAQFLHIPMHLALAKRDPMVPPPTQFPIYNAIPGPQRKHLFILQTGHVDDDPGKSSDLLRLQHSLGEFFASRDVNFPGEGNHGLHR